MIAGVWLRHYKNYENVNFLPICDDVENKYTVYVGNNGVGKSGILEALDVALNNREWNVTANAKKSEAYICPVFLVEKTVIKKYADAFQYMSDYFWDYDESSSSNQTLIPFYKFRGQIKDKYKDNYYLVLLGVQLEDKKHACLPSGFHKEFIKDFSEHFQLSEDATQSRLDEMRSEVYSGYNYLYIPVEQSLNELLRLENTEMQMLLNKNLLSEIEKILTKSQDGEVPIVNRINNYLDQFIKQVNSAISNVDNSYCFDSEVRKKSLTARDIREKILEAYFPLRVLKRNGRKISQLSSGEQRKALIDVAYSVLVANGDNDTEREIVLAIDEPETSMHISNCFNQFIMLENLSKKFNKQIILTTHWYGFLPITQCGSMHQISRKGDSKGVDVASFDFNTCLEERRRYPDVIELKSLFDLATSILTYMRNNSDTKWIICEGRVDKLYLETMLEGREDIKILSVGGCGNVVKLYQLLYTPMSEKNETDAREGKMLFLIDTDEKYKEIGIPLTLSSAKPIGLHIKRLQIVDEEIKLIEATTTNGNVYEKTEIEDCLIPQIYYDSIVDVIRSESDGEELDVISKFVFDNTAKTSRLRGDKSCIQPTDINYIGKKQTIIQFAENDSNKYKIAQKYVDIYQNNEYGQEHQLKVALLDYFDN